MAVSTYLSLDMDRLFETQGIAEIEEINKKIQFEVEEKKRELKILVGERYRDLLQAADSIAEMKTTSAKIENVIKSKEFSQYGSNEVGSENTKHNTKYSSSSVVQLKILTNLIEMISSAIDEHDFLLATQLFLLSRHITTGLKLDANNDLLKKFPVMMKQWSLLTTFRGIIQQRCLSFLENESISIEKTAKCLASLLLLENDGNLEKLLQKFIQIRTKAFVRVIESRECERIKEKLLASIVELITTVTVVFECFVGHGQSEGRIMDELKNLPPTFEFLLAAQRAAIFRTVPDIVLKYRPNVQIRPLSENSIRSSMNGWMQAIEGISKQQLKDLVKFIVSINTIKDIKQKVNDTPKPENWPQICSTLFEQRDLDLYDKFYQPLMCERIYNIVRISWKNVHDEFVSELERLVSMNERVHRDMRHYVWTSDDSDNPMSLKDAISSNKRSHQLLMKVSGYNRYIVDICNRIDVNLEQLLNDLKQYLYENSSRSDVKKMSEIDGADHEKIVAFLCECSKESVYALIEHTRSLASLKSPENSHVIARLLDSFTEICPNLRQCLSRNLLADTTYVFYKADASADEEWNGIVNLLADESRRFWLIWLDEFVKQWPPLDTEIDLGATIRNFSTWESVTIEERDESEQTVQSQILVPQHLSLAVQTWIFGIIGSLNRIIPHTLPKSIQLRTVDELTARLLEHYKVLATHAHTAANQKLAWQFYFDLRVLSTMFVRRENKAVSDGMQQLVSDVKALIDPFDFSIFQSFVATNVKRNVSRLQYEMGCLVPNMEFLNGILSNVSAATTQDSEPNIMLMSEAASGKSWFPLLPIIKSKEVAVIAVPPVEVKEKAKQPAKSAAKKSSMHISASTSALSSFQDWFK